MIFQQPLAAEVELDDEHPYEAAKGDQRTWLVHSGEFKQGCDVGMVSDGHGFEDSPDCERICGGINSKGPMALAIGRQANLLQWGFYGAPDRMTESAKRVFLNAIVYMRRFEGDVPLVQKTSRGRTWLSQYVDLLAEQSTGSNKQYSEYLTKQFPPELTKDGVDVGKLREWYGANEEYLRANEKRQILVDTDLATLKLSNRKPEFLDWLLAHLREYARDELALRLAERYLAPGQGADAATAIAWIEANRPYLFFTDTGGYRWMVDTNAQRRAAPSASGPGK